jgi:hypothetical protein
MDPHYQTNPQFRGGWFKEDAYTKFTGEVIGGDENIDSGDVAKVVVLHYSSEPRTKDEIVDKQCKELNITRQKARSNFYWLLSSDFLMVESDINESVTDWIDNGWRFALYYHSSIHTKRNLTQNRSPRDVRSATGAKTRNPNYASSTSLPPWSSLSDTTLDEILYKRTTCRDFSGQFISIRDLSSILENGVITDTRTIPDEYSNSIEFNFYLFVSRVKDLPSGIYEYVQSTHELGIISQKYDTEGIDELVTSLIAGQPFIKGSSVSMFITVNFSSLDGDPPIPGKLQTIYILTSRIAHMAILSATALGIDTFQSAAFEDSKIASMIGSNKLTEGPCYVLSFGYSNPESSEGNRGG